MLLEFWGNSDIAVFKCIGAEWNSGIVVLKCATVVSSAIELMNSETAMPKCGGKVAQ